MKLTLLFALFALLVLAPGSVLADSTPTALEVQKVVDFYYGPETAPPILVESHLCRDILTEGEKKNECSETIALDAVHVGEPGYLWLNFMVPRDAGPQQILIQFQHDGITRLTQKVSVGSAIRYRTWRRFELDRPGQWTVKILHDTSEGAKPLETLALAAQAPDVASTK